MLDVLTIGTAVRDAFVVLGDIADGERVRVIKDRWFKTGEAIAFARGAKIAVPRIVFATGGGATNGACMNRPVTVSTPIESTISQCASRTGSSQRMDRPKNL